jgi:hypothetical protein
MYRIDNSTASETLPTIGAVGPNVDSFFKDGNPATATESTIVPADWLNSIQEEICNAIEEAGITLTKGEYEQLKLAIDYYAQKNNAIYASSGSSPNSYTATLDPAPLDYTEGMGMLVKFANANTNATVTVNVNTLGAKNIKRYDGSSLAVGDIAAGCVAHLIYDGTQFLMLNTSTQLPNIYTTTTDVANTYTATLTPIPNSYYAGQQALVKFTHGNTGAATINFNSLGAKAIKRSDGTALSSGDIYDDMVAYLVYDGTNFQIINRRLTTAFTAPAPTEYLSGSGTYSTPVGALYLKIWGVGAGGGGQGAAGSMSTHGNAGTAGTDTTFDTATGAGGNPGSSSSVGGTGGTATGGTMNFPGAAGGDGQGTSNTNLSNLDFRGGPGGGSSWLGGAAGGSGNNGKAGVANTGAGGGGAHGGGASRLRSGSGGGGGGSFYLLISTPSSSYSYSVGVGGAGGVGPGSWNGGAGANGRIYIEACYQ